MGTSTKVKGKEKPPIIRSRQEREKFRTSRRKKEKKPAGDLHDQRSTAHFKGPRLLLSKRSAPSLAHKGETKDAREPTGPRSTRRPTNS